MPNRRQRWFEHCLNREMERQLRKRARRVQTPKQVRRKEWQADLDPDSEQLGDVDYPLVERVMPRDTRERQRANLAAVLAGRAAATGRDDVPEGDNLDTGIVVRVGQNAFHVQLNQQRIICRMGMSRRDGMQPVVGDRVQIRSSGDGTGALHHILPRRTQLTRPEVGLPGQFQVVVANADQVLIVASWRQPAIWFELIDRYLIAAERGGLRPVVCINKLDLAEATECHAALKPYVAVGYTVVFTSAVTGLGLEGLRQVLRAQVTVLAGLSGVGKSSLLRGLLPDLDLRVDAVSRHSGEGRHTTTQAQLIVLPDGGAVVDTPGIRELGLADLRRAELAGCYPEFAAVANGCRFANCIHSGEPDCAVAAAAGGAAVSTQRYTNYLKILGTLPE